MEKTTWKELYRIGGIALIAAGISYFTLMALLVVVGGLPTSGEELLNRLVSQKLMIQVVMIVFIIKDLCALVAFPTLFISLKDVNKTWPLIATVFASVAIILDIISGLVTYSLPSFASSSIAAANTAQPAYLVTSELIFNYIWKIETPFMVILLSLAAMCVSLGMLKGIFNKFTAYLGIVLGVVGVLGGLLGFIQPVLLLSIWYLVTGIQLLRLESYSTHGNIPSAFDLSS